ncbi:hypothetical protein [Rhodococcus sp. NCIMB 12038]|uniref:hypothetical protein n=1 Tax=Rhodococcus sp. NCIMB 12038 TaxID=933800 RepID=UPI000B3D2016|nr:hypothetical protein [Rhodococcus sp. NCIMB 12038]OUS97279.1 hypothetical protein CA951_02730 [Rhodococcus sp. NCIMB 12038]
MTAHEMVPDGVQTSTSDGAVSWWSPQPPAVAPVEITVGRGATIEVDAAYPGRVLSWVLAPGGDIDALATAFCDTGLTELIEHAISNGVTVTMAPAPHLTGPWIRRALVAAVQRWAVRPVDESALILDEASSQYRTGNTPAAARLFALASPTLMALGRQCLDGDLVGGPAEELREITRDASQAVTDAGWGSDILELAAALQAGSVLDDLVLAEALSQWELADIVGASHLGADTLGPQTDQLSVDAAAIDPATVPPRVLAWSGAGDREMLVEYDVDADQATVSVALAADVDPLCLETQQLLAYCAEKDTGRMVASVPLQVQGRSVIAQLPCRGFHPDVLHFGVYCADTDLDSLRLNEVGQLQMTVDRWMLDAWNHHRTALAAVHTVPADADETLLDTAAQVRDDHIERAITAADTAAATITEYLAQHPDSSEEIVTALQARHEVILGYLADLDTAFTSEAGDVPSLLAEMIPADPWDEDDN